MISITQLSRHALAKGVAAAAIVCAVAGTLPSSVEAQEILNVGAFGADANQLNPFLSGGGQDRALFAYVFNGLTRFPPGSMDPADIELDLAESYESSDDGLTWTFVLRDGVQFHHGYGELTAADVVYSLNRARNPETSGVAANLAAVESVEALDDKTVQIKLSSPVPTLLGMLADPQGGYIVSQKAAEELGDDIKATMVGTGPFQFDNYTPKQQSELSAHDDYFRGAPKIQEIVYRYIPDETARELAFASGEIDMFYGRREQTWVDRMRAQYPDEIEILIFAPRQSRLLHLNRTKPPLDDIRVRQAIQHAINRDEFQQLVGEDITTQLRSPVPSGFLGQTTDVPTYDYDPDKARALLAEAGYPDGVDIEVLNSKIASLRTPYELVMEQLRQVGINADTEFVDHAAWHAQIRQDESGLIIYGGAPFPDADSFLTPFFLGSSAIGQPAAQTNFSHCDVADEEINAARSELDPDKRNALWATAQQKIMEDACSVPIFELLQVWGKRANLDLGYELEGSLNLGPPITENTEFKG
ncbi:MAG: ABC transporter substrate-binding protein [Pseudomonadota bacterium]